MTTTTFETIPQKDKQGEHSFSGPRGWQALRHALRMRQDALKEFKNIHQRYGDLVYLPFPNKSLLVFDPADIKHILSDNHKNYVKSSNYKEVRPILGQGLVTSEGELWKRQRRAVGKEFHHSSIKEYAPAMIKHTQLLLEKWQGRPAGEAMDIAPEMNALALDIACETLFGIDLSSETKVISRALATASQVAINRIYSLIKFPRAIPFPSALSADRAIRTLDRIVYRLIAQYEESAARGHAKSILAKMAGQGLHDRNARRQLRDEVMTLLLAGHETTATALTWTFFLLSSHPRVEEKMRQEISRVCGGRTPSYDDLEQLEYVGMVFKESLRLFPPVPVLSRRTVAADSLGGRDVKGGQDITIIPQLTHRDPRHWREPDSFIPERFEEAETLGRHSHCYLPFAAGPRKCIGEEFSMTEGKLVLSMVLQRFQLRMLPGFNPIPMANITLRSQNGMLMVADEV